MTYLGAFLAAAMASLLLTPAIRHVARGAGWLDEPSPRGIHTRAVPRLGGVAVALAAVASVTGTAAVTPIVDFAPVWPLLAGGALVLALGVWDDIGSLGPVVKLTVETTAALVVVASDLTIDRVTVLDATYELGPLAVPVTVCWIVGVANAFNLLDGLDGLVAGLAIIAAATCAAVLVLRGHVAEAVWLAALLGATVGFLPYNFHPASIFLGDAGSLFVGFSLAVTAISGWQKGATVLASGVPLLIFAIPIVDTATAVVRRWRRGEPGRARSLSTRFVHLFEADRGHVHHRLLGIGLSQRGAALALYLVAIALSVVALFTIERP